MYKFTALISLILILFLSGNVYAENSYQLSTGISVNEVPKALFGTWRINAKLDDTNSYQTFKPKSSDIWNLSKVGNIIILSNPFTGVNANISLNSVEGNFVVFTKKTEYDNKILTDVVSIKLDANTFKGINSLMLETLSVVDKHVIKSESATYLISGEKISGDNILKSN